MVVVEEIKQAKAVLSVENQRTDEIVRVLKSLQKCTPSKKILLDTKIGHVINSLRKHECDEVKALSREILKKWKQFYREQKVRQPIEVQCDAKAEVLRMKARKLLGEALVLEVSSDTYVFVFYHLLDPKSEARHAYKLYSSIEKHAWLCTSYVIR